VFQCMKSDRNHPDGFDLGRGSNMTGCLARPNIQPAGHAEDVVKRWRRWPR